MTADLAVAVARRRALLEVHALEEGIFTELFLDGEGGLLELSLARKCFLLLPALFLLGGVVGEQVELLTVVPARRVVLEQHAVGDEIHTPDEQIGVCDPVEQGGGCLHDLMRGGGVAVEIDRAVRLSGQRAAVAVDLGLAVIAPAACRVGQIFDVVADGEHDLVGDEPLVHQIEHKQIGHLAQHEPRLVRRVGAGEHLPGADALERGRQLFDGLDGARLPAPGVVDEQLGVFAEQAVQQLLVALRAERDVIWRIR